MDPFLPIFHLYKLIHQFCLRRISSCFLHRCIHCLHICIRSLQCVCILQLHIDKGHRYMGCRLSPLLCIWCLLRTRRPCKYCISFQPISHLCRYRMYYRYHMLYLHSCRDVYCRFRSRSLLNSRLKSIFRSYHNQRYSVVCFLHKHIKLYNKCRNHIFYPRLFHRAPCMMPQYNHRCRHLLRSHLLSSYHFCKFQSYGHLYILSYDIRYWNRRLDISFVLSKCHRCISVFHYYCIVSHRQRNPCIHSSRIRLYSSYHIAIVHSCRLPDMYLFCLRRPGCITVHRRYMIGIGCSHIRQNSIPISICRLCR